MIARNLLRRLGGRKALRGWPRPRGFDRDLVVIGAGSAGLVTAYVAAAVKAKVSLVERRAMGGDCLNTGCVPSKALLRTTRLLADARRARALGLRAVEVDVDFAEVMQRVQRVIARVAPHDSVERYTGLGVDVILGEARITSPYTVEVGGRTLTTRGIVVASGAEPAVPPIPGIEDSGYLTSETVWDLRRLPQRLLVLGGGPIGCELAQAFARLGSRVTLLERGPRLLPKEDPEVAGMLAQALRAEGVDLRTGHEARAFVVEDGARWLVAGHGDGETRIGFDALLVAVGRRPRSEGLGLEALGVPLRRDGTIEVNEFLQTRYPSIYAVGDVTGPLQLTHFGAHQAWYAAVNALFGGLWRFAVDYSVIPRATFTDPEIARVGLNEREARERGVDYEVTTFDLAELDRAIADEADRGLVKVLTVPGKDRILGVTIAGEHAGELIAEHALAMRHGLGLGKLLRTVHTYPTMAEANKYVAGEWRRAHAPETLLRWLARYHRWKRGR